MRSGVSVARLLGAFSLAALALMSPSALAHGGGEMNRGDLALQPARTLAQQALAEIQVRNDTKEAAIRLDAALQSKDKADIDQPLLRRATETLDAGNPEAAVRLLDEALSRPLGATSGKALHEAGREFQPGTGAQEIVGIAAGAALLLLGAALLLLDRRRGQEA